MPPATPPPTSPPAPADQPTPASRPAWAGRLAGRLRLPRRTERIPRRVRLPRRTVRLKLTLLYGALFLACGTALLAVTYFLVAQHLPTALAGNSLITSQQQQKVTAIGGVSSGGEVCFQQSAGGTGVATLPSGTPPPGGGCAALLSAARSDELRQLVTDSGIALAIMAAASTALGWVVAGRVLQPLRTITTAARRISASSLHQRLALDGPDDELTDLGKTFNSLLARLERSFTAQRQFVANASHELRTPLARQRTLVEVALRDPDPTVGSLQHTMQRVLATGDEQERLIEALLTLARSQRGLDRREPLDLAAVTGAALAATGPEAERRRVRVNASLSPAPARGDQRLAERLAANLMDNAIRHNVPGGWVEVATGIRSGRSVLSVSNTGPLIPPEQVEALFQPFGRLDAARTSRDGLGLGLSIVIAIADAHDADLRARPLPSGGLEVEIHFPRVPDEPPDGSATQPQPRGTASGLQAVPG
jgi:signal transduction histidine kinase